MDSCGAARIGKRCGTAGTGWCVRKASIRRMVWCTSQAFVEGCTRLIDAGPGHTVGVVDPMGQVMCYGEFL